MRVAFALLLAAALLACGRAPSRPAPAAADSGAPRSGLLAVGEPSFRPPADGLLTDAMVEQFLRVRRAAKGRTDAEAARALGIPAEEVAWTRARIIEALAVLDERRVREASAETYARTLAALRSARSAARSPEQARSLDDQIAVLERERASVRREQTPPPTLAINARRIAGRRAELEAVAP